MPRTTKPKILGPYARKPKLDPKKLKVGKAGPKAGKYAGKYVAKRITPKPGAAAAPPAAPTGPYPEYADFPAAQRQMLDLDRAEQHHQQYVSQQVMPWQAAALQGLQAFNTQAQDQLLGQLQGAGQGAFNAAAAATPLGASATTPGGVVAGPYSYLNQGAATRAAGLGSAATAIGQHQAALAKIQPTTLAQGFVNQLADYARGLPELYTQKRNERRAAIEQFIAEVEQAKAEQAFKERQFAFEQAKFEEQLRSNRVDEAIRATNAETNAAVAFGNLGLRAEDIAAENAPPPVYENIPPGYIQLPDGRIVRDPTFGGGGGGGASGGGRGGGASGGGGAIDKTLTASRLKKQGFVGGWRVKPKKRPPGAKGAFVQASDTGQWFIKQGSGGGGSSSNRPKPSELGEELADLYLGKDRVEGQSIGSGWQSEFRGRPKDAASQVVRWVLDNKAAFMGSNRAVNIRALQQVLGRIPDEAVRNHVIDILDRGYISNDRWRPT